MFICQLLYLQVHVSIIDKLQRLHMLLPDGAADTLPTPCQLRGFGEAARRQALPVSLHASGHPHWEVVLHQKLLPFGFGEV